MADSLVTNTAKPLYTRVHDAVENDILDGKWREGDFISSEQELCRAFSVSRITAMRVLNDLEDQGYIERQRGKGSMLVNARKQTNSRLVHLVSSMDEHLYTPLARTLMKRLEQAGFYLTLHDVQALQSDEQWDAMLSLGGGTLIVDTGSDVVSRHIVRVWRRFRQVIFVINGFRKKEYPASYILTDGDHGVFLQVSHAIQRGYRKIVYFSYSLAPYPHRRQTIEDSIAKACHGVEVETYIHDSCDVVALGDESNIQKMIAILESTGKGCAVVADNDHKASFVHRAAERLGWKIGQDVGVVGFYDTPWAKALDMTSVSIDENAFARWTVELVKSGKPVSITVPPVLIERSSTLHENHRSSGVAELKGDAALKAKGSRRAALIGQSNRRYPRAGKGAGVAAGRSIFLNKQERTNKQERRGETLCTR